MTDHTIDLTKTDDELLAELVARGLSEEMARSVIALARTEQPPDRIALTP